MATQKKTAKKKTGFRGTSDSGLPDQEARTARNPWDIFGNALGNPYGTRYRESQSQGMESFLSDIGRDLTNFGETALRHSTGQRQQVQGGGLGDSVFGRKKPQPKKKPAVQSGPSLTDAMAQGYNPFAMFQADHSAPGNMVEKGPGYQDGSFELNQMLQSLFDQANQPTMSYGDALSQAQGMVGWNPISYDPERATARGNASEADARLEAMYRQLRDSITADEGNIAKAYQGANQSIADAGAQAQQATQQASNAADDRNNEVLANLGISDAQQQIIGQGRDLNTQTAGAVADMAAKQQNAATNLSETQAAAVQQNRGIAGAAGLEGNLQRAQNQSKLQALLAKIDMAEQQENAAGQQNAQQQSMSLAQMLMQQSGNSSDRAYGRYQDMLNRSDSLSIEAQNQARAQQELMMKLGSQEQQVDPTSGFNNALNAISQMKDQGLFDWDSMSSDERSNLLKVLSGFKMQG